MMSVRSPSRRVSPRTITTTSAAVISSTSATALAVVVRVSNASLRWSPASPSRLRATASSTSFRRSMRAVVALNQSGALKGGGVPASARSKAARMASTSPPARRTSVRAAVSPAGATRSKAAKLVSSAAANSTSRAKRCGVMLPEASAILPVARS